MKIFLFLLLLIASNTVWCKTVPISLCEMETHSWVVVRGKVTSIGDTGGKSWSGAPILFAKFAVSDTLKGQSTNSAEVIFVPAMSTSPNFMEGEEYLLFLTETPFGYATIRGYRGAIKLGDANVYTGDVEGEPDYQRQEELLKKVRSCASCPVIKGTGNQIGHARIC